MIGKKLKSYLYSVASEFVNPKKIVDIKEINSGHVNDTYLIIMPEREYILQKINSTVFKCPYAMIHNVKEVTEFIRKKVIYEGNNPLRNVLKLVKTKYNQDIVIKNNKYYRMMEFISNSISFNEVPNKEIFKEMGYAIGDFQNLIQGFPVQILDDTIKNFHNTFYRFKELKKAIQKNYHNRKLKVLNEIDFFYQNQNIYDIIINKIKNKEIPIRVTHNDTKISNILFDKSTQKALCLIDLDTVMKGSLLYDYGDALRSGSCIKEDDDNLNNVLINFDYFKAFNLAYLEKVKTIITIEEVKLLYYGYLLMTIEVAMRFLTDYLNGDIYFKINYEEQNLFRTRCQIKMAKEIITNKERILKTIIECLKELDYPKKFIKVMG